VVPQADNLDAELTVRENLLMYARYFDIPQRVARDRAEELLAFVQLAERRDSQVETLSGGMKRRLTIARALVNEPELILLDEPTTGLDPQARHLIWERLYRLKRQGTTLLLTTHYMEEADQLCHRLAIIDHGRMLALDTPERLKASVGADTIVTISTDTPDREGFASRLRSAIPGATGAAPIETGVRLEVQGSHGVLPAVVAVADEAGVAISDLRLDEPSLETVFIKLTGKDLRE
jgi:ABC-type multidrug transport system ATPase subunit